MDRRSLKRLLVRLANEKQVKNIRTVLRCGARERVLQFICHPSITMDNSVIRSAIEQAKLKLFCISRQGMSKYSLKNANLELNPSVTQSVKEAKEQLLTGQKKYIHSIPIIIIQKNYYSEKLLYYYHCQSKKWNHWIIIIIIQKHYFSIIFIIIIFII